VGWQISFARKRLAFYIATLAIYLLYSSNVRFEWDKEKEQQNIARHGVDFVEAQEAFSDPFAVIRADDLHSQIEPRFFCFGRVLDEILTVRFTYRRDAIRIIGAGYWRK
jgi:uncharacterized DUF497 family protein